MICLRCGYCCCVHDVIVPLSMKTTKKGIVYPATAAHKPGNSRCWNLVFRKSNNGRNIAFCKIHGTRMYISSPCKSHGQIEECKKTPCRTGAFLLNGSSKNEEFIEYIMSMPIATPIPIPTA